MEVRSWSKATQPRALPGEADLVLIVDCPPPRHLQQRESLHQNTFEWQNNLCLISVLDLKLEV